MFIVANKSTMLRSICTIETFIAGLQCLLFFI